MGNNHFYGVIKAVLLFLLFNLSACGGGNSTGTCPAGFYGVSCNCQAGPVTTVVFTSMATTQVPSLVLAGLSITGSADINILNLTGLGIVGGGNDISVDGTESISFAFTVPVVDVSYFVNQASNGDGDLFVGESFVEIFDESMASLGSFPVNGTGWKDVSDLVGGQEQISSFTITADADYLVLDRVEYSSLICTP
jgi:hypothetical protein